MSSFATTAGVRFYGITTVFLLSLLCFGTGAGALLPDASVTQFKLPVFSGLGYKKWDVQGSEGIVCSDDHCVDIKGMRLTVLDGTESLQVEATLESPTATLFVKERRAEGPGYLFVTTPHYTLVGHGWSWHEEARNYRVHLKSDVRVVFKSSLDSLLELPMTPL